MGDFIQLASFTVIVMLHSLPGNNRIHESIPDAMDISTTSSLGYVGVKLAGGDDLGYTTRNLLDSPGQDCCRVKNTTQRLLTWMF